MVQPAVVANVLRLIRLAVSAHGSAGVHVFVASGGTTLILAPMSTGWPAGVGLTRGRRCRPGPPCAMRCGLVGAMEVVKVRDQLLPDTHGQEVVAGQIDSIGILHITPGGGGSGEGWPEGCEERCLQVLMVAVGVTNLEDDKSFTGGCK